MLVLRMDSLPFGDQCLYELGLEACRAIRVHTERNCSSEVKEREGFQPAVSGEALKQPPENDVGSASLITSERALSTAVS